MELIFGIIAGVLALTVLVVLHELGHAIVARRNGVVVEEFGIGFPPRAWGKKLKKQTIIGKNVLLSVNWLPLGGFVKLQGEHDSANKKGDYGAASFWVKTKILLAGVIVNWVTAVVLLTVLACIGMPKILPNQFTVANDTITVQSPVTLAAVVDGSPAAQAGLKKGDVIVRFDQQAVASPDVLSRETQQKRGQTIAITYTRDGTEYQTHVTLRTDASKGQGYLGVSTSQQQTLRSTWSAPIVGLVLTGQLTAATFEGLGNLVSNVASGVVSQLSGDEKTRQAGSQELQQAGDSVAGPIGILGVLFPAASQAGPVAFLFITALISLTLAVMNILPIPALDGGRWFTMAVFRILKKPLTKEREESIQATGFLVLMLLIIVVTVVDVSKLIK
ncbi:MAG: M50 family metallopeptidase [Candidatus Saccharimonadales bacterium]